jgi:hypothetical protein
MAEFDYPYRMTISTLGDLKVHGMGLYAHCTAPFVGHGGPLDIDSLIEKFGADFVYINETRISRSCICRHCGHKGAKLTVIADTTSNGYAKRP